MGGFGGFLFSIFTMGNAIASPMVKCFRLVCENFTTFPFGKHIIGKLNSWAFWRYIQFQNQPFGLWEISKKVTTVLRNFQPTQQGCRRNMHIHEWTPRRTAGAAVATARRDAARSQLTLGRLVWFCHKTRLWQTDGQMVRITTLMTALVYASRGKNAKYQIIWLRCITNVDVPAINFRLSFNCGVSLRMCVCAVHVQLPSTSRLIAPSGLMK